MSDSPDHDPARPEDGGLGAGSPDPRLNNTERVDSGLTVIKDARLTARAIEGGWVRGRWNTHTPKSKLIAEIKERGDVTLAERATLAVYELLENKDDRPKGIGARCAVAMERQNQVDELHALATGQEAQRQGAAPAAPFDVAAAMDATVPNVAAS